MMERSNALIYNKKSGTVDNYPGTEEYAGIPNDWDGGISFYPGTNDKNICVQVVDSYRLIEHANSPEFQNSTPQYPGKKAELEELAKSLNENDNPVLMLVKLKE